LVELQPEQEVPRVRVAPLASLEKEAKVENTLSASAPQLLHGTFSLDLSALDNISNF